MNTTTQPTNVAPRANQTAGTAIPGHTLTPRMTWEGYRKKRWLVTCSCGWISNTTKTTSKALRLADELHLAKLAPQPVCPTPGKQAFKSREKAVAEVRRFWRTGRGQPMPSRVYECLCGAWHMTKEPRWGRR